jgi:hypothetical protein
MSSFTGVSVVFIHTYAGLIFHLQCALKPSETLPLDFTTTLVMLLPISSMLSMLPVPSTKNTERFSDVGCAMSSVCVQTPVKFRYEIPPH